MEIIPYIDDQPAGTPQRVDVLWLEDVVYVDNLPKAKLEKRVPEELGKLCREGITSALHYGYERSAQEIGDYDDESINDFDALDLQQSWK